ncbi:MAG: helix-turn-helix transcriptional regulator [Anaerolineales bacterium]|nr:helix-turn-helix transcriptional regulator [Anaerolineales bacterium]
MNITFRKLAGDPSLGIVFFWMMTIESGSPASVKDQFIPELFFDYLYIKTGTIQCVDKVGERRFNLPEQVLKMLFTHALEFTYSTPLMLFGARLSLRFVESFPAEVKANCFLNQAWVKEEARDLESFKRLVEGHLRENRREKFSYPLFSSGLNESGWLVNFSPRHKRRLYTAAFGLSRKELQNIHNLHAFLEQACDFSLQNPRIIQHVTPDVFYDQPHLNHAFKKMTGLSPVEYFQASSILQDNLMSASYNEISDV